MGQITLQGVHKSFGPLEIIKDANLDIEDGSFVVFVGPSGCGKTTLLRLIAGLEDVTGGQILIDQLERHGVDQGQVAPAAPEAPPLALPAPPKALTFVAPPASDAPSALDEARAAAEETQR